MTSREALRLHREKTKDRSPHEQVYFFHAHIYYDGNNAEETEKAHAFQETLRTNFCQDDQCEIHTIQDKVVGPHPLPFLEVLFTRDHFTYFLNYLAFTLPSTFSALIHQLTKDQVGDHTTRAIWLGKQLALKPEILHKMDTDAAARGVSEEDIIWAVHAPRKMGLDAAVTQT